MSIYSTERCCAYRRHYIRGADEGLPVRQSEVRARCCTPGLSDAGYVHAGFCICARAVMGDRRWEAGRKGGVMGGGVSRSSVTASLKIQGERSADKSVTFAFLDVFAAPPSVGVANTNQTSRLCHIYVGAIYSDGEPPRRLHLQTQLDTSKQEGPSVRACEHVCSRLHVNFRNTATSSASRAPGCA